MTADTVYNFTTGTDKITLDNSEIETAGNIKSGATIKLSIAATDMSTGGLVVQFDDAGGITIADTTELLVVGGASYTNATLATALTAGAARAAVVNAGIDDDYDGLFVAYSDGTDGYIGVLFEGAGGNGSDTAYEAPEIVNLIKLAGVTEMLTGTLATNDIELVT